MWILNGLCKQHGSRLGPTNGGPDLRFILTRRIIFCRRLDVFQLGKYRSSVTSLTFGGFCILQRNVASTITAKQFDSKIKLWKLPMLHYGPSRLVYLGKFYLFLSWNSKHLINFFKQFRPGLEGSYRGPLIFVWTVWQCNMDSLQRATRLKRLQYWSLLNWQNLRLRCGSCKLIFGIISSIFAKFKNVVHSFELSSLVTTRL